VLTTVHAIREHYEYIDLNGAGALQRRREKSKTLWNIGLYIVFVEQRKCYNNRFFIYPCITDKQSCSKMGSTLFTI